MIWTDTYYKIHRAYTAKATVSCRAEKQGNSSFCIVKKRVAETEVIAIVPTKEKILKIQLFCAEKNIIM